MSHQLVRTCRVRTKWNRRGVIIRADQNMGVWEAISCRGLKMFCHVCMKFHVGIITSIHIHCSHLLPGIACDIYLHQVNMSGRQIIKSLLNGVCCFRHFFHSWIWFFSRHQQRNHHPFIFIVSRNCIWHICVIYLHHVNSPWAPNYDAVQWSLLLESLV